MKINRFNLLAGAVFSFLLLMGTLGYAGDSGSVDKADPTFGGQILSLTDPGEKVEPTFSEKYKDNNDGTVTDIDGKLVWERLDSYQQLKKWINWNNGQGYIADLNKNKFAGSVKWRLPTKEELGSLYDETKSVPWNYYWTRNEVHIDPVFGKSGCCYWSSDEHKEKFAWGYNFIRGKAYLSLKGGNQYSLTVIRAVRDFDPNLDADKLTSR